MFVVGKEFKNVLIEGMERFSVFVFVVKLVTFLARLFRYVEIV